MHPESFLSNFRGACHLEVTLFSCLLASSRRPFRALKMRPVRQVLFCVPQKRRRVPEKAVLRTECLFRTVEACFLHRMLLKMRRVPQEAFLNTECSFRTVEACFWYGALPKTRRTWLSGAQASCCRCGTSNFTKERGRPLVDLVQYSANSYLLSWNLVHPSLKKATICLAAASPALMLASAV